MVTGPEHYQAAERLIAKATKDDGSIKDTAYMKIQIAAAQVHATLAQAAASALTGSPDAPGGMPYDDFNTWYEVAGEHVGNK